MKTDTQGRFKWVPVALFGSVMGLSGLSHAWRLAHVAFGTPLWLSDAIGYIAAAAFVCLVVVHGIRTVTSYALVRSEFLDPAAGALFATPLISCLLVAPIIADINLWAGRGIWGAGTLGMMLLAWSMTVRWLEQPRRPDHVSPAWMLPLVGMMDIPLAVPALGLQEQAHGVAVMGFTIGAFFTLPLFTIIFAKLIFADGLPKSKLPSLFILIAPFAVGVSSYYNVTGRMDFIFESLYVLALFFFCVVVTNIRHIWRACPFRVSWWSVSFPLAALSGAALRYGGHSPSRWNDATALGLLGIASAVIFALLARTLVGLARGDLQRQAE